MFEWIRQHLPTEGQIMTFVWTFLGGTIMLYGLFLGMASISFLTGAYDVVMPILESFKPGLLLIYAVDLPMIMYLVFKDEL